MLNSNLMDILLTIPGILIGFTLHGLVQAYTAIKLGDFTPRKYNRLTIEPKFHIDLLGFLLAIISGFGWSRSIELNPVYIKKTKQSIPMIYFSGIISYFFTALLHTVLLKILFLINFQNSLALMISGLQLVLYHTIKSNISLFIFNLLPIYPLDGYYIFSSFVPYINSGKLYRFQLISKLILITITLAPIASYILNPMVNSIYQGILLLFKL